MYSTAGDSCTALLVTDVTALLWQSFHSRGLMPSSSWPHGLPWTWAPCILACAVHVPLEGADHAAACVLAPCYCLAVCRQQPVAALHSKPSGHCGCTAQQAVWPLWLHCTASHLATVAALHSKLSGHCGCTAQQAIWPLWLHCTASHLAAEAAATEAVARAGGRGAARPPGSQHHHGSAGSAP